MHGHARLAGHAPSAARGVNVDGGERVLHHATQRARGARWLLDGSLFDAAGVGLLVCNAGKGWGTRTKNKIVTEDGFESFLQVNYLSHFLLSINLLPDLVRGANACGQASRVVHVSSSLHDPASRGNRKTSVRLDLESLARLDQDQGEPIASCSQPLLGGEEKDGGGGAAGSSTFNPKQAYCRSKLMQIMFSYELQQRLRAHDLPVTSSCLNPGFIPSSGLIRDSSWLGIFFLRYCLDGAFKLCCSVTRSLDNGGTCVYLVATQPEAADGGLYFEYTRGGVLRAHSSSEESYDTAKQQALWDTSCRLCGVPPNGGLAGAGGVGRAE